MAGRRYSSKRSSVGLAHLLAVAGLVALWSVAPCRVSQSEVFVHGCARSTPSASKIARQVGGKVEKISIGDLRVDAKKTRGPPQPSGIAADFKKWADTLTAEEKTAIGTQAKYFYNSSFRKAGGHVEDVRAKIAEEKFAAFDTFFTKWFNDTARRAELVAEREATFDPDAIFEHIEGGIDGGKIAKETIRKEIVPLSVDALERRHWASVLGINGGQGSTYEDRKLPFDPKDLGLDPELLPPGMPGIVSDATDAYEEDLRDTNMTEDVIVKKVAAYLEDAYQRWAIKFMKIELMTQHSIGIKLDKDYLKDEDFQKLIDKYKKSLKDLEAKFPEMKKELEKVKTSNEITAEEYDEALKAIDSFSADEKIKAVDDFMANFDQDEQDKVIAAQQLQLDQAYGGETNPWRATWYKCDIVTGPGDRFFLGMFATEEECDKVYARFEKRYNDAIALDEEEAILATELMAKRLQMEEQ